MKFIEINPFVRYCTRTKLKNEFDERVSYTLYDRIILYFFSGNATLIIGSEIHRIEKGGLVIINPNITFEFTSYDADAEICLLHFDYSSLYSSSQTFRILPSKAGNFCAGDILSEEAFEKETAFNEAIVLNDMKFLEESFLDMSRSFKKRGMYYEISLKGRLMSILVNVSQHLSDDEFAFVKNDLSDRIIEFIDENYTKPISNKQLGEIFNFNPLYISKLVKNKTGYSLHEYIVIRRISRAVQLLENTDHLIMEVGFISGFGDLPHFSRSFKKYMGVSPDDYRKRVQSKLNGE